MNDNYFPNRILYKWLLRELRKSFKVESICLLVNDRFTFDIKEVCKPRILVSGPTGRTELKYFIWIYDRQGILFDSEQYLFEQRSIDMIIYKIKTENDTSI
jgi:hypothetical protein